VSKSKGVDLSSLAPGVADGLTQGPHAKEEAEERFPYEKQVSGEQIVQQHLGGEQKTLGRVPVFRALLRDDPESVWVDGQTDRLQRNVIAAVDKETLLAMKAGHICLRCYEPHEEAFPEMCYLCGYPMRERQIMDIAMEFRGNEHVGPATPFNQFLAEQEERKEKAKFARKIAEGGSRMIRRRGR
jgi:hypothetical protein